MNLPLLKKAVEECEEDRAGRLFDRALEEAGIDRASAWTDAVLGLRYDSRHGRYTR